MRRIGLGVVLAAMLVSGPALGYFMSGNDLLDRCRLVDIGDYEGGVGFGFCLGYTLGIVDVMIGQEIHGSQLCSPDNVEGGQLRDIVVQYLEENPAERHFSAESLVAKVLSEAFPCQ